MTNKEHQTSTKPASLSSFSAYWIENIKLAKDGFDITMLLGSGVFLVFTLLCWLTDPKSSFGDIIARYKLQGIGEGGTILFFSGWCFIWLPFRQHQKQQQKCECEYNELQAICDKLTREQEQQSFRFANKDTIETVKIINLKLIALRNAYDNYRQLLEPQSRENNLKVLQEAADDFFLFYQNNRIFLPEGTEKIVYQLFASFKAASMQFSMALTEAKNPYRDESTRGKLFDLHFETDSKIPEQFQQVEADFRSILGVSQPGK